MPKRIASSAPQATPPPVAKKTNHPAGTTTANGVDHFSFLPREMLQKIFEMLKFQDLGRLATASKMFNEEVNDNYLSNKGCFQETAVLSLLDPIQIERTGGVIKQRYLLNKEELSTRIQTIRAGIKKLHGLKPIEEKTAMILDIAKELEVRNFFTSLDATLIKVALNAFIHIASVKDSVSHDMGEAFNRVYQSLPSRKSPLVEIASSLRNQAVVAVAVNSTEFVFKVGAHIFSRKGPVDGVVTMADKTNGHLQIVKDGIPIFGTTTIRYSFGATPPYVGGFSNNGQKVGIYRSDTIKFIRGDERKAPKITFNRELSAFVRNAYQEGRKEPYGTYYFYPYQSKITFESYDESFAERAATVEEFFQDFPQEPIKEISKKHLTLFLQQLDQSHDSYCDALFLLRNQLMEEDETRSKDYPIQKGTLTLMDDVAHPGFLIDNLVYHSVLGPFTGNGTLTTPSMTYTGNISFGRFFGEGTLTVTDQHGKKIVSTGYFEEEMTRGKVMISQAEQLIESYEGHILDGQYDFIGHLTRYAEDGSKSVYRGIFKEGAFHGNGTLTKYSADGTVLNSQSGIWKNGVRQ